MENEELLSKKELLQNTDISYGQLYRWKRENLIPESWFIKKSSFTGQETFFPREKILKRVSEIMSLKDQYSLDQLARMFSPEPAKRIFFERELKEVCGINQDLLDSYRKYHKTGEYTFTELLFLYLIDILRHEVNLSEELVNGLISSIEGWVKSLKDLSYRFILVSKKEYLSALIIEQQAKYYLDNESVEAKSIELEELSREIRLKFNYQKEQIL